MRSFVVGAGDYREVAMRDFGRSREKGGMIMIHKLAILAVVLIIAALLAAPAAAHVHLFNPSDECSGGQNPQGSLNPAGKDVPATPSGNNSQAFANCAGNR